MSKIERSFRLATQNPTGVSCDANGLYAGQIPLLARRADQDGPEQWRARPLVDLNCDLSSSYGLPIDLRTKMGGLAAVADALNQGELVRAQIAALYLQLPDPPGLAKSELSAEDQVRLAGQLRNSKVLKANWDTAKHPRWPAGSADSTGGEFAPAGGGGDSGQAVDTAPVGTLRGSDAPGRTLHARTDLVDRDGTLSRTFIITPASKVGGVIVQKVVSTDTLYGSVIGRPLVGWEAWEIAPGEVGTDEGKSDDVWLAPPPSDAPRPSVAALRTITGEARFYEGVSLRDLVEEYGFRIGGSGFSGELPSTTQDPHLPTDNATPALTRTRTFEVW